MQKKGIMVMGKYISILHRQEQKYISLLMKEYGLAAPSYSFLTYLVNNEGVTQRELCSIIVVDDALASRTMGKLEKEGYIIRKRSEGNARSYELYLTDKAKEIIPALVKGYEEWWRKVLEEIEEEDLPKLVGQLKQMAKTVVSIETP